MEMRKKEQIMKPDYLDMAKYQEKGAYHWKYYDENFKKYKEQTDELLAWFQEREPNSGQSIVEIGCGDGLYVGKLAELGYDIAGVDANSLAVQLAVSKGVKNIWLGDVCDYEREHDVCLLWDSFEHFDKPELAVSNLDHIIKDKIYLMNPTWESKKYHYDFYTTEKLVNLFKKWNLKSIVKMPLKHDPKRHKDMLVFER
jgi:2-polyprenyl-3-methyl-5-hydroxy-6-metoxy-1,4-benzoquinol methylase